MVCQHSNPVGYLFCSTCGQALEHQRCLCGFVCATDALYCGRCGHLLNSIETDTSLIASSIMEHRYDLDMLVKLAGVADKKQKMSDANIGKIEPTDTKTTIPVAISKSETAS